MPRASTVAKPKPVAAKPKPVEKALPPIVYPELRVNGIIIPTENLKFTAKMAKDYLGWESEQEAIDKALAKNPELTLKVESSGLKFGNNYLLLDESEPKQKIRCHLNATNRDFRENDCRAIAQSILKKQYYINGETIIIGNRRAGLSLQHRCIALILAVQLWQKDEYWKRYWEVEPYIETLVVTGIEERSEIIQTLDTGVTRILADAYATSGLFDTWKLNGKELDRQKRTEASKLLDAATDLLWKRTGAALDVHNKYQTHASSREFLDRHPSLLKSAKHLFEEDSGRAISRLGLSRGQCAALCYLMGTCQSDLKKYSAVTPPNERVLDFSQLDKADEFWTLLAEVSNISEEEEPKAKRAHQFWPIVSVLSAVTNGDFGARELNDKKLAVVVNAWNQWVDGGKITEKNIAPIVGENSKKEKVLTEFPTCGGIDLGQKPTPEEDEGGPTEEEVKQAAKDERARDLAEKAKNANATLPGLTNVVEQFVNKVRESCPDGSILIFKTTGGEYSTWGDDAHAVAGVQGAKAKARGDGLIQHKLSAATDLLSLCQLVRVKTGKPIMLVEDDGSKITDITPKAKPKAAEKAEPVVEKEVPAPVETPAAKTAAKSKTKGPSLKGGIG